MERRLAEFRARKKAQIEVPKSDEPEIKTEIKAASGETSRAVSDVSNAEQVAVNGVEQSWPRDSGVPGLSRTHLTLLKVLLWLVLLGLFAELEFGLLFFILSLFYWLYEGLRTAKPRQPGEMSAYSVFNPDCRAILGTLTAEQLEGEMGFRPLANR